MKKWGARVNVITAIKAYRLSWIFFLFLTVPLQGDRFTLHALFDVLFPSTSFKRFLIQATQLRSMMDTWGKQSNIQDRQWIEQVIAGRLTHIERLVESMGTERMMFRAQDIEYVLTVLDKVMVQARDIAHMGYPHESIAWIERVALLQEKIDKLV